MPEDYQPEDDFDALPPSKSARKREMHALQALGQSLVALSDKQLASIDLADAQLRQAIEECRRIRSNSARKRHLQYIGKLMRNVDAAAIEAALETLHHPHREATDDFHALESLRDAMLAAGQAGVDLAIAQYPDADRQHLRQLLRQHLRETQQNKPPAASRKLFRYLRELQENAGT